MKNTHKHKCDTTATHEYNFDSAIRSDSDSWRDEDMPQVDPDGDPDYDPADAVDPDTDQWHWDSDSEELEDLKDLENDITKDWFEDDEDLG
jgi:hypothetical protein